MHFNNRLNFFSNVKNDFLRKNKTEEATTYSVNRNILIDNKQNKISLKTENNLLSGFSSNNIKNSNSHSDNFRLNTISDLNKNNDYLSSKLIENTENKFDGFPDDPFGFDHRIQITHEEEANKSLLNNGNNFNNNNNRKNVSKKLNFNNYNQVNSIDANLPNTSSLFNNYRTSNNKSNNIFDSENSNNSYALNTYSNMNNPFNFNNDPRNKIPRPSGNLSFLFTENMQNRKIGNANNSSKNLFNIDSCNGNNPQFNNNNINIPKKNFNSSENLHLLLNTNSNTAGNKVLNDFNKKNFNEKSYIIESNINNPSLSETFFKNVNPNNQNNQNNIKSTINSNANSNKKSKNDNYTINTSNISSNSKIIFRLNTNNNTNTNKKPNDLISNINKIAHLKSEISSERNDFYQDSHRSLVEDKDENFPRPMDEMSNSEMNNVLNRVRNHAFENFRSKNAFDIYTGSKHEKKEIKEAIFRKSKNNPVYVWKKN